MKSREDVSESGIEMLDLHGIEDENKRAKAIKRRLEDDRKKALRVKEAEDKADKKEQEKLQKSQEKSTKKGKRKMDPPSEPEGEPEEIHPVAVTPTNESSSHAPAYIKVLFWNFRVRGGPEI